MSFLQLIKLNIHSEIHHKIDLWLVEKQGCVLKNHKILKKYPLKIGVEVKKVYFCIEIILQKNGRTEI
jgi:hypothetical protein